MDNSKKKEIVIKKNQKAEALRNAPDEVIAGAIRDVLSREKNQYSKNQNSKNQNSTGQNIH